MSTPAASVDTDLQATMRSIIQRIATGPELSKDISEEEARLGTAAIFEDKVDPVRAAIFFIALRMKRETRKPRCAGCHPRLHHQRHRGRR